MSQRRRYAKPGITKSMGYSVGIFTVSTDLRAIVELLGLDRTVQLATALHSELVKDARAKNKNKGRKIKSTNSVTETTLAKQLSDTVQRSLAHYKVKEQHAPMRRKLKAA